MFNNNFVGVVVNKGKIMRETKNELGENVVKLPFGSEYAVRLKNLNTVRAVVGVELDGVSAASGLIINPGTTFELKGFLEGLHVRNKFRFIKKTKEISNHRGDRIDDGLVRISYRFEQALPVYYVEPFMRSLVPPPWPVSFNSDGGWLQSNTTYTVSTTDFGSGGTQNNCFVNQVQETADGITVKGSETKQDFVYGYTNPLETHAHVINIKLVGYSESGVAVKKPITTKIKLKCSTCGRRWPSRFKFCPNCTTCLS
jgi:hypothetical protein